MKPAKLLANVVALVLIARTLSAKDAWVLVGQARGPESGCHDVYTWYTDTVFHNLAGTEANVAVVGQGVAPVVPAVSFAVPANSAVALSTQIGAFPPPGLNIVHFELTDTVLVESRLEYRYDQPCVAGPGAPGPAGKIAFPVFNRLAASREPQLHFGTDLGAQRSRINVGIYNAATVPATAHIELRKSSCFPVTVSTADASIPANTLVQLTLPQERCEVVVPSSVPFWVKYTVIVVDQPSISYVTPVSNLETPNVSFTVGTPQR